MSYTVSPHTPWDNKETNCNKTWNHLSTLSISSSSQTWSQVSSHVSSRDTGTCDHWPNTSSLYLQLTWPSWLWNWLVTIWPKVVLLSQRSSAPKITSRSSGSSSSSSRRCRPPSRRHPGTSLLRSLSSARVRDALRSLDFNIFSKGRAYVLKKKKCFPLSRISCPG